MGLNIEKKLLDAGYKMLGQDESIEKLILNILKTKNNRYLKAIPFLIYKHKANIEKIDKSISNNDINNLFKVIITITIKIFKELNINYIFPNYCKKCFSKSENDILKAKLNYNEFKQEFELQLRNDTRPSLFIDKQKIYAERDLQMHLSRLFTKKEKHIIHRLLNEKPISKTDYEYYSRKTRKKITSIIGLHDFAKVLYEKTPKYDEKLYSLKKKLEKILENNFKEKEISIIDFFLLDNSISINYKKKDKKNLENQFNAIIKIKDIIDKELLNLIEQYKKHDFL